ncbi:unnamed protein product [Kuraishia capsulata CBS 1993]|uniref:intramembrane prenyl-peptidase Rce1 n=1 Tax=Kuraishia capsulata CBS 1993 TaxID=1382522 RepID=W6MRN1_9ASCO|nr:uncharacterized protein KUCA_T00005414001 [Kuraishia capsulata CBS 1993]CDK29426.1 unnamed protein product [Kuraishia capsulata CBS 1993]
MELRVAIIYAVFVSASYPLSIYVGQSNRAVTSRNDHDVMKRRMKAVSAVSLFHLVFSPLFLARLEATSWLEGLSKLGVIPGLVVGTSVQFDVRNLIATAFDTFKVLALVSVLFIGPTWHYLYDCFLTGSVFGAVREDLITTFTDFQSLRDYIVSPATEEFIYSSVIMSIFLPFVRSNEISFTKALSVTPLLFGFAHVHHAIELHRSGRHSAVAIAATTVFQLAFTSIFGLFTNFVFVRTASVWPCIFAHIYCNFQGFPDLRIEASRDLQLAYYLMLALGIVGFKDLLYPLTQHSS